MGNAGSSSQRHARRRDDDGLPNHQHFSADQEAKQYTSIGKQLAVGAVVTGAAALFASKFVVGAAVAAAAAGTAILALSSRDILSNDSDAAKKPTQSSYITQEDLHQRCKTAVEDQKPTVEGHFRRKRAAINTDLFSHIPGNINQKSASRKIKIMCYNIWGHVVQLNERMKEIGRMVQEYSPDIILFQEVIPDIYNEFESSKWREAYACSDLPQNGKTHFCMVLSKLHVKEFSFKTLDKVMAKRKFCLAHIDDGFGNKLVIASTHFKRAEDNDSHKKMRVGQAKNVISMLSSFPNAIFGGDLNWDDDEGKDGAFPLKKGWVDAWKHLKPGENGWTYDTESNPMLSNNGNRTLQRRFDRFICKLRDFKLTGLRRIGTHAIPGIYNHNGRKKVPVLASDHYGLLLEIDLA